MMKQEKEMFGTMIEQGIIVSIQGDGYRIDSYSRDGLTTKPIKAIADWDIDENGIPVRRYGIGDKVFFFLFEDGNGMILGKL